MHDLVKTALTLKFALIIFQELFSQPVTWDSKTNKKLSIWWREKKNIWRIVVIVCVCVLLAIG